MLSVTEAHIYAQTLTIAESTLILEDLSSVSNRSWVGFKPASNRIIIANPTACGTMENSDTS